MAYLDDLPVILRGIREYRALAEAFDPVMEDLQARIAAFPLAVQPGSAEGEVLERWEKMAGLTAAGSPAQRRFRLVSRLGSLRPYTPEQMKRQLAAAFGREDAFVIDMDQENFVLSVEVDPAGAEVLAAMTEELRRMVPANLILQTRVGRSEYAAVYTGAVLQVTAVHDIR